MSWNYRIVKDNGVFNIKEVYYTRKKPHSWSADPMYPQGETFGGLLEDFSAMQQAFSQKVLEVKKGKLIETFAPKNHYKLT